MEIILKNKIMEARFETEYGKLIGLKSLQTGWEIQRNNENTASFEMLIPIPGRQCSPVDGRKQKVTQWHRDGDCVTFVWDGVETALAGRVDVKFTATVQLAEQGLLFGGEVENHSPYRIEDVKYPFIGELERPAGNRRIDQMYWTYGGMKVEELYPNFDYTRGYWGRVYPLQQVETPKSNFSLFCAEREGIYFGCHDTEAKKMTVFCYEARPAVAGSFVCNLENAADHGAYRSWLNFFATHLLYTKPGHTETLPPIAVCPFAGSWHKGMDLYKAWRKTWFRMPKVPKWALEPHAWFEIQMCNYGEGYRFNYRDLVRVGRECAENGIRALQIVGWTREGQDGCLPDHSIEPRLGSLEDLKTAVAEVEAMGVKVVLYTKYLFADTRTDWFRNELKDYASRDIYGDIHSFSGYYYENISNLSGINTHRLAMMCLQSKAYREICKKQMQYCLDVGASGVIYDEPQSHYDMPYCFSEMHGHETPANNYHGDLELAKDLREVCDAAGNEDFLLLCEDGWDLQHQYYGFSYFRISTHNIVNKNWPYVPVQRYVDPYFPIMASVWGHNDRDAINMNVVLRLITSYESYQFKGNVGDFPLTLSYGKLADALRLRYRSYLWDGEFRDTQEGSVTTADGAVHYPYAVYNRSDGKQGIVMANLTDEPISVKARLEKGVEQFLMATPEAPDAVPADSAVTIMPRSLVLLMEN